MAVMIAHDDAFHRVAVPQPPQGLYRAVRRFLPALRRQCTQPVLFLQDIPQAFGQVLHFAEAPLAPVEPAEHLSRPVGRESHRPEIRLQFFPEKGSYFSLIILHR